MISTVQNHKKQQISANNSGYNTKYIIFKCVSDQLGEGQEIAVYKRKKQNKKPTINFTQKHKKNTKIIKLLYSANNFSFVNTTTCLKINSIYVIVVIVDSIVIILQMFY